MTYTNYTIQPSKVLPSAAAGATVTPSGTAFVNSAWVQLTAGIANEIICCGLIVNPGVGGNITSNLEVGKGAATSEVVVGTILCTDEALGNLSEFVPFVVPISIAANTRVAVRLRKSDIVTTAWTLKLVYYEIVPILIKSQTLVVQAVHRAASW